MYLDVDEVLRADRSPVFFGGRGREAARGESADLAGLLNRISQLWWHILKPSIDFSAGWMIACQGEPGNSLSEKVREH
jgi:hypothetical protein